MLHGQSFDVGGLLLTEGFALGLGPGLATVVSPAVGLSLGLLAAGKRGSWLASNRRCSHGGAPKKRREERGGIGEPAPRRCAGEVGVTSHQLTVANGNHAIREGIPGQGPPALRPQ